MTDPFPPLVSFVFLDVTDIEGARGFFEHTLGLTVAEDRFRPPHHIHGVVKFDAGTTLLSLNKARPGYDRTGSDHAVLTLTTSNPDWPASARANPWIREVTETGATSVDNHVFRIATGRAAAVTAIDYAIRDLTATRIFHETALSVDSSAGRKGSLEILTATLPLRFTPGRIAPYKRRTGLFLTVLHADPLSACMGQLARRGVSFMTPAQDSAIGRTVRFADPDGHHFCLYEPSEESLGWESGPTLRRLVAAAG